MVIKFREEVPKGNVEVADHHLLKIIFVKREQPEKIFYDNLRTAIVTIVTSVSRLSLHFQLLIPKQVLICS